MRKKFHSIDEYIKSRILTVLMSKRGQYLTEQEITGKIAGFEFEELRQKGVKADVVAIPSPSKVPAQLATKRIIGSTSRTNAKEEIETLYGVD